MFQFPSFAPPYSGDAASPHRVAPFGNQRIKGCVLLPVVIAAVRVLPRQSEPRHPPDALG